MDRLLGTSGSLHDLGNRIAEAPIIPTAPAIRNAILDAIGKPLYELPMNAERVLEALDQR